MIRSTDPDVLLRSVSGGVGSEPRMSARATRRTGEILLLVHGFNVAPAEAAETLGEFRSKLAGLHADLLDRTFSVAWEGDWRIPVVRPAAYPFMLKNALASAETFYEAIRQLYDPSRLPSGPDHVVIVAHSLGCRLTVEMLRLMQAGGRPDGLDRLTVILMAAAIPTGHLRPTGRPLDALRAADRVIVLHSEADGVLSRWFRIGQTLAGEGWFPVAVGTHGGPCSAAWDGSVRMAGFDHSDYWAEAETAQSVGEALGRRGAVLPAGRPLAARKALASRRLDGSALSALALPAW